MAVQASWAGKPGIKGSSESLRMALLTFSLIGLQLVSPSNYSGQGQLLNAAADSPGPSR